MYNGDFPAKEEIELSREGAPGFAGSACHRFEQAVFFGKPVHDQARIRQTGKPENDGMSWLHGGRVSDGGGNGDLSQKLDCVLVAAVLNAGMDFETLTQWADEELKALVKILPPDVKKAAETVSISFEEKPGTGTYDEQLEGDELGLFEGPTVEDEAGPEELSRIRLFLSNLWEWSGEEEHDFRDEVGTTFLHELGHYLGWDEDDVAARGLE